MKKEGEKGKGKGKARKRKRSEERRRRRRASFYVPESRMESKEVEEGIFEPREEEEEAR